MPFTPADFTALRSSLEAKRKRLEKELADINEGIRAIDVVEKIADASIQQQSLPLDPSVSPVEMLDMMANHISFAQRVRNSVAHFKDQEFTVKNVEDLLRGRGEPLPEKYVRPRIAMEMQNLVKSGKVVITKAGAGNAPHHYRLVGMTGFGNENPEKGEGASQAPSFSAH